MKSSMFKVILSFKMVVIGQ